MVAALRAAGLDPVPHVSARRILDRNEFGSFLKEATSRHGVHRVLVIGGDEPKPKGPFNDSLEVLRSGMLAEAGIKEIGVSGYPEGHPRIAASALDQAFNEKLKLANEQGLGLYVVTQFSFAPKRVVDFCAGLARSAPSVSVYVGIAGPSDPVALLRYAQRCGVSTSLRALRNLGTGIARLEVHTDPQEQVAAHAGYLQSRAAGKSGCSRTRNPRTKRRHRKRPISTAAANRSCPVLPGNSTPSAPATMTPTASTPRPSTTTRRPRLISEARPRSGAVPAASR
jgi:methylenetetrahydrofolate reductase (NADPH)